MQAPNTSRRSGKLQSVRDAFLGFQIDCFLACCLCARDGDLVEEGTISPSLGALKMRQAD